MRVTIQFDGRTISIDDAAIIEVAGNRITVDSVDVPIPVYLEDDTISEDWSILDAGDYEVDEVTQQYAKEISQ
jgi:hypothetical protein